MLHIAPFSTGYASPPNPRDPRSPGGLSPFWSRTSAVALEWPSVTKVTWASTLSGRNLAHPREIGEVCLDPLLAQRGDRLTCDRKDEIRRQLILADIAIQQLGVQGDFLLLFGLQRWIQQRRNSVGNRVGLRSS